MINADELIIPLAGDDPAGENCEYDDLYQEMDVLSTSIPDKVIGDSVVSGRGADWKKLEQNCLALWKRTRDLRVAAFLVVCESVLGGLRALYSSFKLLNFLVSDMWDSFYPKLDPDDGNDPLQRLNILAMLSPQAGAINDPVMFLANFRLSRLIPELPYTIRDLMISQGDLETGEEKRPNLNLIVAELLQLQVSSVEEQANAAKGAKEAVLLLCNVMNEKIAANKPSNGSTYTLNMQSLLHEIEYLENFWVGVLQKATGFETADTNANNGGISAETAASKNCEDGKGGAPQNLSLLRVGTRSDALLLLRKGAEYFQRTEPSSPIPLLVERAVRFADMNFMDLLADIAPDALSRGKDILGLKEGE